LNRDEAATTAGGIFTALESTDHPAAAGSAAALAGAVAAAIVCKAARAAARTASSAQAAALQERLLQLARVDADVLAAARAALADRARAGTGEQRDFALGQALRRASEVPRTIAEACTDVAQLAASERAEVQPDFSADVTAAAILAAGAAQAASALVASNLLAHENDEDVVAAQQAATTAAGVVAQLTAI
jgi:formiminotetrahydrofolate cyclodeaminase